MRPDRACDDVRHPDRERERHAGDRHVAPGQRPYVFGYILSVAAHLLHVLTAG
jgi:hypothetical protein